MELQQLREVVEVARCGSISKAARRLYMGQPNLSKALKEAEREVGRALFRRTNQGVEPTRAGEDFLYYAREVLAQMERLEALYAPQPNAPAHLSVWMPRASYLAEAYAHWLRELDGHTLNLQCRETAGQNTLEAVMSGEAQLGILRFEACNTAYFESVVQAHGLHQAPLWQFQMQVLFAQTHPLARLDTVPLHRLNEYPFVTHGDSMMIAPPEQADRPAEFHAAGRVSVFDRASAFDALRGARGSYMWVSPVPGSILQREELCQRPCPEAPLCCDAAVWQGALPELAGKFLQAVQHQIQMLVAG